MGWFIEDKPHHEGYLVGLVREERGGWTYWRELAYPADQHRAEGDITTVQVGCECGWRSSRLVAPALTKWAPHVVVLEPDLRSHREFEEQARALWNRHASTELASFAAETHGGVYLHIREP